MNSSASQIGDRSLGSSIKIAARTVPLIRPGVIVHRAGEAVDALLSEFSDTLHDRGFRVMGYMQRSGRVCSGRGDGCGRSIDYIDIEQNMVLPSELVDPQEALTRAVGENADLLILSRFSGCLETESVRPNKRQDLTEGLPLLTSISGQCIHKWFDYAHQDGTMLTPDMESLWNWWGPENLYRDLSLGVSESAVRRIVCGTRWIMVEGERGTGLAYLPRSPRTLSTQLQAYARKPLSVLAALVHSWDPVEMALGVAAINAHYNRYDLEGDCGNGVKRFRKVAGRIVVIGAFPGIGEILPNRVVVEADPRPGEYPTVAMDILLPGCEAAIVNASVLINRTLPRILRLTRSRPLALIGPATPLTPRLFDYGVSVLGGFVVTDPVGLAAAVRMGGGPRDFGEHGKYMHIADGVRNAL